MKMKTIIDLDSSSIINSSQNHQQQRRTEKNISRLFLNNANNRCPKIFFVAVADHRQPRNSFIILLFMVATLATLASGDTGTTTDDGIRMIRRHLFNFNHQQESHINIHNSKNHYDIEGEIQPSVEFDLNPEMETIDDRNIQSSANDNKMEPGLPPCQDDQSICGYMQLNSAGINMVPICSCTTTNGPNCPLSLPHTVMDVGRRTIRHGNDFYKFCGPKPKLEPCRQNEVAYVSYGRTDLITGERQADIQQWRCLCPNDHILRTNETMFEMKEEFYIYGTEQICQKLPSCTRRQHCLSITETAMTTIERRHCRCGPGQYCSKDIRHAQEIIHEDRGTLYNMRCI